MGAEDVFRVLLRALRMRERVFWPGLANKGVLFALDAASSLRDFGERLLTTGASC